MIDGTEGAPEAAENLDIAEAGAPVAAEIDATAEIPAATSEEAPATSEGGAAAAPAAAGEPQGAAGEAIPTSFTVPMAHADPDASIHGVEKNQHGHFLVAIEKVEAYISHGFRVVAGEVA